MVDHCFGLKNSTLLIICLLLSLYSLFRSGELEGYTERSIFSISIICILVSFKFPSKGLFLIYSILNFFMVLLVARGFLSVLMSIRSDFNILYPVFKAYFVHLWPYILASIFGFILFIRGFKRRQGKENVLHIE